ncbi:hypothetical protein [Sinomonas soli]
MDEGNLTVKQGFYLGAGLWDRMLWRPVILTVAQSRLRLTDKADRVLLDAAAPEVSARFSFFGMMHLTHHGRRFILNREGSSWSSSFSQRQQDELKAAGMPVPKLAGGSGGGGGGGILDALDAIAAVSDSIDAAERLADGGSLRRNWTPILTAIGCRVEARAR